MSKDQGYRWINIGFLPIHVCVVKNARGFKNALKNCELPDEPYPEAQGHCMTFTKNGTLPISFLMFNGCKKATLLQVIGLVTHECAHVWQEIRLAMGEESPSMEFEAYTLQGLVQDVLRCMIEDLNMVKL